MIRNKKRSFFQFIYEEMNKRKEAFILLTVLFFSVTSVAYSQSVIERYRVGNYIECCTFISEGQFAGKFAFADGWNVYTYDIQTGIYEKLFCQIGLPLNWNTRGICYISQGDFAGNFLLNDAPNILPNKLYIVSSSGNLIGEVTAVDFNWNAHCEDITQITSGPYQGNFAMIGRTALTGTAPHIFIFRIEDDGGNLKAYLVKDIFTEDLGPYLLAITFLPDDYPDPYYRNHFVCTDLYPEPDSDPPVYSMRVIDDNGMLKTKFSLSYIYEALAYISKGPYKGKFIISDTKALDTWVRNLDGSEKIPYDISFGFGILLPQSLAWLETSDQFMIGSLYGPGPLLRIANYFIFLSRIGSENWIKEDEKEYPVFRAYRDMTERTADERYYLFGYKRISGQYVYEVHRLLSDFTLEQTYSLPTLFFVMCYIPGQTAEDDKFAMVKSQDRQTVNIFDKYFSNPTEIDLSGTVDRITDICYDADSQKYYILDSDTLIRVFDSDWTEIDQCDVSNLAEDFVDLVKITSGDLHGNFALLNHTDCEIVIINFENQKAVSQLESLIEEIQTSIFLQGSLIQISSVKDGLKNSLIKKLENAINSIEKGNINAAINLMRAFQNEVQAQSGTKIPVELAERWISKVEEIIQSLMDL